MSEIMYDLSFPPRVIFGWGRRSEVGSLARSLGARAFVVTGSRTLERNGTVAEISDSLRATGVEPVPLAVINHEPLVEDVDRAVFQLREWGAKAGDFVLAIGGGSAIDLAKAASALVTQSNAPSVSDARSVRDTEAPSVLDFLEGKGNGRQIIEPPLPVLAMPTTGGTGTEATKNAVISSLSPPFKTSLRSVLMVPRIVLIDPELSVSVPPHITAYTGMDAITQLIESYVSRRAQPIPQALALQGLEMAAGSIVEAVRDGTSRTAREKMAHAAFLSGVALANSGLGMAHGVAAALGVVCGVPHGLACAVMLPAAMRFNRPVCEAAFAQLGTLLTGRVRSTLPAAADDAIGAIDELLAAVNIPRQLSSIGVRAEHLPDIVNSSRGSSMSGNPRDISDDELGQILENML